MIKSVDPRLQLLAHRIGQVVERFGSIAEVARQTGIPTNTVSRMMNGKNEPSIFNVTTFAEKLGVPLDWLVGANGGAGSQSQSQTQSVAAPQTPPGTVMIDILDVQAATGAGSAAEVVAAETQLPFPTYFIDRLIRERKARDRLSCLRAKGNSMEPTIMDGALLILDEAVKELPEPPATAKMRRAEPDIYVFFTSDGLRLKRLKRIDQDFVAIISDNAHDHPLEMFRQGRDGRISVIGKVIWWDNRL